MALRRACTLFTITTLAAGLAVAAGPTDPAAAASGAVNVGTVQALLTTTTGRLIVGGDNGIEVQLAPAPADRTVVAGTDTMSLAEAPDGSVYASGPGGLRRLTFDGTGAAVSDVAVGDRGCLGDVAATTAAVWVVSSCTTGEDPGTPTVLVIDRTDESVTVNAVALTDGTSHVALASTPAAPTRLAVSDDVPVPGEDDFGEPVTRRQAEFHVLDVAGTTTTSVSQGRFGETDGSPVLQFAPDGKTLLAGAATVVSLFDSASGAHLRDVQVSGRVLNAAFTADGAYLAVSYEWPTATLNIYRASDGLLMTQLYGTELRVPSPAAWEGRALVFATTPDGSASQTISTVATAYRAKPQVVFEGSDYGLFWGRTAVLHGTAYTAGGAAIEGLRLTVSRTDPTGKRITLGTTTTGVNGTFTVRNVPSIGGKHVYAVTSAATDEFPSVGKSAALLVGKGEPGLSITTDRRSYRAQQYALITVKLSRHHTNRSVSIYATGARKPRLLLKRGVVNAAGYLRYAVYIPWHTTFVAVYTGDGRYTSDTARAYRPVRATVVEALTKPLTRSKGYYVYRAGTRMVQGARVRPFYTRERIIFTAQQFVLGKWRRWGTGSAPVNQDGDAYIGFKGARGVKYRLRATASGNYLAYGANGAWRYVTFR